MTMYVYVSADTNVYLFIFKNLYIYACLYVCVCDYVCVCVSADNDIHTHLYQENWLPSRLGL